MLTIQQIREQYPQYGDMSDTDIADRLHARFYADLPKMRVYDRLGLIEQKGGAPADVRALVGNARTPQDRLATLQKFFPDAEPYGDDNFVFTDPQTKRMRLYNPKGFDVGDVASMGRTAAEVTGATVGGVAGTGAGPAGTVAGAMLGGEAGGQLYDIGAQLLGQVDTRPAAERVGEAATNIALAGAGEVAAKGVAAGAKRLLGGGPKAAERGAVFNEMGVQGLAGDVTGSPIQQAVQSAAANIPGGAGRVRAAAQESLLSFEEALKRTAGRYGSGETFEQSGAALQQGGQGFIDRFKKAADVFYRQVDNLIPFNAPVTMSNTQLAVNGVAQSLNQLAATGERLTPQLYRDLAADLAKLQQTNQAFPGALDWQQASLLRSKIGEMLSDPALVADTPRRDLKRLYAAITTDLEAVARLRGPASENAFRRARDFYEEGIGRIERVWGPLLREGITPERVAQLAQSETRIGGTKLMEIRRTMQPAEWDTVASATINQLGRGPDGTFDPGLFLRKYEALSPEAKTALFKGGRYTQWSGDLDKLADIARSMRETGRLANTSRTATTATWLAPLLGFASAGGNAMIGAPVDNLGAFAVGAAAPFVGSYAGALMSSPAFVRWLSTPVAPNGVAAHVGRLSGIAAQDSALVEPIRAYLSDLAKLGLTNGGTE